MAAREDFWPTVDEFIPERFLVPEDHELYPIKHAFLNFLPNVSVYEETQAANLPQRN
jgi:hypothetical protein